MHHPKIGDVKSLEKKFAPTKHLAGKEQAGVASATAETIQALAQANTHYETKNGFIFIVCATGKSAAEMLRILQDRLTNSTEEEVHIAMGEQAAKRTAADSVVKRLHSISGKPLRPKALQGIISFAHFQKFLLLCPRERKK